MTAKIENTAKKNENAILLGHLITEYGFIQGGAQILFFDWKFDIDKGGMSFVITFTLQDFNHLVNNNLLSLYPDLERAGSEGLVIGYRKPDLDEIKKMSQAFMNHFSMWTCDRDFCLLFIQGIKRYLPVYKYMREGRITVENGVKIDCIFPAMNLSVESSQDDEGLHFIHKWMGNSDFMFFTELPDLDELFTGSQARHPN